MNILLVKEVLRAEDNILRHKAALKALKTKLKTARGAERGGKRDPPHNPPYRELHRWLLPAALYLEVLRRRARFCLSGQICRQAHILRNGQL